MFLTPTLALLFAVLRAVDARQETFHSQSRTQGIPGLLRASSFPRHCRECEMPASPAAKVFQQSGCRLTGHLKAPKAFKRRRRGSRRARPYSAWKRMISRRTRYFGPAGEPPEQRLYVKAVVQRPLPVPPPQVTDSCLHSR